MYIIIFMYQMYTGRASHYCVPDHYRLACVKHIQVGHHSSMYQIQVEGSCHRCTLQCFAEVEGLCHRCTLQ